MQEVNLNNAAYRLILGKVGFWVVDGVGYLANPSDAYYLEGKFGSTSINADELGEIDNNLTVIWNEKVSPILTNVLSGEYIPGTVTPIGVNYWNCAGIPYFGVQVLHSEKFIGQYCGIYELTKDEFRTAMQADRTPWAVVEHSSDEFKFIGDANSDWMIDLTL